MSAINYILTLTYGGKPAVVVESDIKKVFEILQDGLKQGTAFGLIDARRAIVSAGGMVAYNRVYLDCDDAGMIVKDRYGTTIDSYSASAPARKTYCVRYWERWEMTTEIEAESEEEAIRQLEQHIQEGGSDVTADGGLTDSGFEIV